MIEHLDADMTTSTDNGESRVGLLTAGEWNDLNNWEDWKALIQKEEYVSMEDVWELYPNDRYSVFVSNKNNIPLQNAEVHLWNEDGKKIWTSITDNGGGAELWNNYLSLIHI